MTTWLATALLLLVVMAALVGHAIDTRRTLRRRRYECCLANIARMERELGLVKSPADKLAAYDAELEKRARRDREQAKLPSDRVFSTANPTWITYPTVSGGVQARES